MSAKSLPWLASVVLMISLGGTCALGEEPATAVPPPQPAATTILQPVAPTSTYSPAVRHAPGMYSEDCHCVKCIWYRTWLGRQIAIHHHDKCKFHWYIRGNGPAIHERPGAIYWW